MSHSEVVAAACRVWDLVGLGTVDRNEISALEKLLLSQPGLTVRETAALWGRLCTLLQRAVVFARGLLAPSGGLDYGEAEFFPCVALSPTPPSVGSEAVLFVVSGMAEWLRYPRWRQLLVALFSFDEESSTASNDTLELLAALCYATQVLGFVPLAAALENKQLVATASALRLQSPYPWPSPGSSTGGPVCATESSSERAVAQAWNGCRVQLGRTVSLLVLRTQFLCMMGGATLSDSLLCLPSRAAEYDSVMAALEVGRTLPATLEGAAQNFRHFTQLVGTLMRGMPSSPPPAGRRERPEVRYSAIAALENFQVSGMAAQVHRRWDQCRCQANLAVGNPARRQAEDMVANLLDLRGCLRESLQRTELPPPPIDASNRLRIRQAVCWDLFGQGDWERLPFAEVVVGNPPHNMSTSCSLEIARLADTSEQLLRLLEETKARAEGIIQRLLAQLNAHVV